MSQGDGQHRPGFSLAIPWLLSHLHPGFSLAFALAVVQQPCAPISASCHQATTKIYYFTGQKIFWSIRYAVVNGTG
ncbi:MAG TPA: hypothetical protein VGT44_17805 [Ktedonobacteraceae bacterium]|nr:hypothetical protein [Ktedonobacteraceae bacterium]